MTENMSTLTGSPGDDRDQDVRYGGGELVRFPTLTSTEDSTDDDTTEDTEEDAAGPGNHRDVASAEQAAADAEAGVVRVDPPPVPASMLGPVWERETVRQP